MLMVRFIFICIEPSVSFLSEKKALCGKAAEWSEKIILSLSQALEYLTGHWAKIKVCGAKCVDSP